MPRKIGRQLPYSSHCRANLTHIRQSRPDSGLGFQAKVLKRGLSCTRELEPKPETPHPARKKLRCLPTLSWGVGASLDRVAVSWTAQRNLISEPEPKANPCRNTPRRCWRTSSWRVGASLAARAAHNASWSSSSLLYNWQA